MFSSFKFFSVPWSSSLLSERSKPTTKSVNPTSIQGQLISFHLGVLDLSLFNKRQTPCILQEKLCSTFWQQESLAARSLGLLMSRTAKSPGRSCPTPSNRDEMN